MAKARRIWAISAIHADVHRLMSVHDQLYEYLRPGDRVIYTGNMIGHGDMPIETLDEILAFRRGVLAMPGMMSDDFIYLRGGQEEMWEKLQQLQLAPNPKDVLNWMLDNGMAATLEGYGVHPRSGLFAACEGVMAITKWTSSVRAAMRRHSGHDVFQSHLRRAAYTSITLDNPLLFVHAGVNVNKALENQGDTLWWGGQTFNSIEQPYHPFRKIVRGFDPSHHGVHINSVVASIDGGCGFGGSLICAGFDHSGEVIGIIEF